MAFTHGKDARLKVTSGGTLRDLSDYLLSVSHPFSADTAETTVFTSLQKTYVAGLKDATISAEGRYDPTVDGWINTILGGAATAYEFGPAGTASGAVKYSGSVICTAYEPSADLGDMAGFTVEFQVSGGTTRGTY